MSFLAGIGRSLVYLRDLLWTYALILLNRLRGGRIRRGRGARIAWGASVWGNIELGDYVYIGPRSDVKGRVIIGRGTRLNGENYVRAGPNDDCSIIIGSYGAIAPRASFFVRDHDIYGVPLQTQLRSSLGMSGGFRCQGSMEIMNDVWIGYGALILGNVKVGNGAVIGAMSVVTRDVPPYTVAVGVPARPVKERFPREVVECLEASRWWEYPPGEELAEILRKLEDYIKKFLNGEPVRCPINNK